MSAVTATWEPWGRAMTLGELDALPDDGRRHELIDGTLLVTPAPSGSTIRVCSDVLFLTIHAFCRSLPTCEVIFAPADVRVWSKDTNLQPDLLLVTEAPNSCQGQEPASARRCSRSKYFLPAPNTSTEG